MNTQLNTTTELELEQKELEASAVIEGVTRYERTVKRADTAETIPAQIVIKEMLEPVADALRVSLKGGATQSIKFLKFLNFLPLTTYAFIGVNTMFNKLNRPETEVRMAIGRTIEDELNVQAFKSGYGKEVGDREGLLRYLVTEMNKRQTKAHRRMYLTNSMDRVAVEENFQLIDWNDETRIKLGGVIVDAVLSIHNVFQRVMRSESARGQLKSVRYIEPTAELLEKLGDMHKFFAVQRPVYGPMIVSPRPWDKNLKGGYLTKRLGLIKGANDNYLTDALESGALEGTFHALNMLQDTAWVINSDVLSVAKALWDSNSQVAGLPDHGDLAKPSKPAAALNREDAFMQENPEEWKAWKREMAQYYAFKSSAERLGKIYEVNSKLNAALRYEQYDALYFVYQLDFRGRMYPVSTTINPQGDDLSHGLLSFANGKRMTSDAAVWLAVHGANTWANDKLDKKSFTTRHQWVLNNESHILASARDPLNYTWWAKAENPWQFLAFCFEWNGWKSEGEDFLTTLPVAADGSCNGIQHYAAMMRDENEGGAVNLVPKDEPADIYTYVAEAAAEIVLKDAVEGSREMLAEVRNADGSVKFPAVKLREIAAMFQGHVNRKFVKRGVMTTPYGVSKFGIRDQLKAEHGELFAKFDRRVQSVALSYATDVVSRAIGSAVSSATLGMEFLQSVAKLAAQSELPIVFSTADGFPVQVAHKKMALLRIRTTLAGGVNVKVKAASGFRDELDTALAKRTDEQTRWAVLATLSYEIVHGNLADPAFPEICRDLLTTEFDAELVEYVVENARRIAPKFLVAETVVEGDKTILNFSLANPTDELDKAKQARAIGPHFVHAADACHLRMTLNALAEHGVKSFAAVHDSYAVHATDFELMSRVLREQFVAMHSQDLFAKFLDEVSAVIPGELMDKLPQVPTKGGLDLNKVLESDYFFA